MENIIYDYIKRYKGFEGLEMGKNFLKEKRTGVTVKNESYNPVVKEYIDGTRIKQCIFSVSLKGEREPLTHREISDAGLLKGFAAWIALMNKSKDFPKTGKGILIEPVSDINITIPDIESKIYSIRIKYIYYQGKEQADGGIC